MGGPEQPTDEFSEGEQGKRAQQPGQSLPSRLQTSHRIFSRRRARASVGLREPWGVLKQSLPKWCRSEKEKSKPAEVPVSVPFERPPAVPENPRARGNGARGDGCWLLTRVEEKGVKRLGPAPAIQEQAEGSGVWVYPLQSPQSEKGWEAGCVGGTKGEGQAGGEKGRGCMWTGWRRWRVGRAHL